MSQLKKTIRVTKTQAIIAIVSFALIGVALLISSRATSPTISYETESATLSGGAIRGTDTNASGGQYVEFKAQAPLPAGWEDAVNSNDINVVRDWYIANTGFESYYDPELGRKLTEDDLEPYTGPHKITQDGTVIERKLITSTIVIAADNVVIRGSKFVLDGGNYGIQIANVFDPYPVDVAGINWKIEHVTLLGVTAVPEDSPGHTIFARTPGKARYVKVIDGFVSGLRSESSRDQLWEYNYVDRIVTFSGTHNTSFTLRSNTGGSAVHNITVRRNLLLDGTSSALSFYTRSDELHTNVLFQENIFDIFYPEERGVNYCVNRGSSGYSHQNVRWINNIYGQSQEPTTKPDGVLGRKCGLSNHSAGDAGDEFSGNRYIDGTLVN